MSQTLNENWESDGHGGPGDKRKGYRKVGWTGNHVTPTQYVGYGGSLSPRTFFPPSGAWLPNYGLPTGAIDPNFIGESTPFPHAMNRAWSRFVQKVRTDPAELGTFLAEGREGLEMVARRATGCYRAYRDLRRGDLYGALRNLDLLPDRKTARNQNALKRGIKTASDLWLEYSFGWKPMFGDIYDGCKAITQPVPGGPVSGSGSESYYYNTYQEYGLREEWRGKGVCKVGADVFVSNPNLYLLQQMGVANPIEVAWELVPFSFVVDWVFDVGSCLGSITDLLGCDVQNAYHTSFLRATGTMWWYPGYQSWGSIWGVRRNTGLPLILPNANIKANLGLSLNRAANAVSLLGQILAG